MNVWLIVNIAMTICAGLAIKDSMLPGDDFGRGFIALAVGVTFCKIPVDVDK